MNFTLDTYRRENLSKMKRHCDSHFKRLATNPNLNQMQHEFLAEISTIRHYAHSKPEQLFYDSSTYDNFIAYSYAMSAQAIIDELGLQFPYKAFQEMRDLPRFKDIDDTHELSEAIDSFVEAYERMNTAFEEYLKKIADLTGINYSPSGHMRSNENSSHDAVANKLEHVYYTMKQRVSEHYSVQDFESHVREEISKEFGDKISKFVVRFADETYDPISNTVAVKMYISCDDTELLKSLVQDKTISLDGTRVNFIPVENAKLEVEKTIPERKKQLDLDISR